MFYKTCARRGGRDNEKEEEEGIMKNTREPDKSHDQGSRK